ncbi:MAG: alpha/beta fold hydrolase [Gemmatimonadetes bacterium]|nr:alpha/beta fold hydrolase [Gemmatimonadota bacterium]
MSTARLEALRLVGADGGPLRVDIRSGARPGEVRPVVVICHGFKGFKDWGFFPRVAERLAWAGFTAVSFNFSGSGVGDDGESFDELERWGHQTPSGDLADVGTVVDFLAGRGAEWFGLFGHSRGGGLAVLHAARDSRVRSLVTWAAVSHFLRWPVEDLRRWRAEGKIDVVNTRTGQVLAIYTDTLDDCEAHSEGTLDVLAAAARIRIPWLIVHGQADETVPHLEAQQLHGASTPGCVELALAHAAGHTFGVRHPWAGSTPEFDSVLDRTVRFFAAALR